MTKKIWFKIHSWDNPSKNKNIFLLKNFLAVRLHNITCVYVIKRNIIIFYFVLVFESFFEREPCLSRSVGGIVMTKTDTRDVCTRDRVSFSRPQAEHQTHGCRFKLHPWPNQRCLSLEESCAITQRLIEVVYDGDVTSY